ncbi:MAG: biotin transporter BioY [Xenococcaceae cyanobacterium]
MSAVNELLWALIGLLLTIGSTFIEVFVTNPPWNWAEQGFSIQPLSVTYQIGAVLLTGCLGGKNAGALSQIAYVVLGLYLLPVFAQGGGLDYIKEPSFGYILGFIPGAWLCGLLAFRTRARLESLAFSSICGLLTIHLFGLVYLICLSYFNLADSSTIFREYLQEAMMTYSVAPLPGQLVIVCAVAVIAFVLRQILFY